MSLKPFAYPLPETRFLHAGRLVYKFKIRYGNFISPSNLNLTESAAKESEEVIRVILGNLDDLHPFSTDHFTVFPCILSFLLVNDSMACISWALHNSTFMCRSVKIFSWSRNTLIFAV